MSKYIDADAVKQKYPDRRSLCEVMDEAEEVVVYTAEQFREDMELVDKMCGNTACSDCRFNSQSCDTFCMDLNTLRAWAEAERAKGGAENGKIEVYHRDTEQFREDMKLLEKMCEHTVCADCPFSSRSCATSDIDLNELRAWAEAERKKVRK